MLGGILLLILAYRAIAVYTIQYGECRPKPVDPNLRLLTRNERGQIEYPRRRFFQAVTDVFAKYKRTVPVFSDKHLSATWEDAKWVYDHARKLYVPFLAGSSVPVTWRRPDLVLPKGCELVGAVQIGYGPFEGYGFHALEGLQCMVERRTNGQQGVRAVMCLEGDAVWKAGDDGVWSWAR